MLQLSSFKFVSWLQQQLILGFVSHTARNQRLATRTENQQPTSLLPNYLHYVIKMSNKWLRAFGFGAFYVSETENIRLRKTMTKLQLKISRHDRRVGTKLSKQSWKSERNIKQKWRRFFLHNRNKKLWKNPKIVIWRRFKHIRNLKEAFFHHLHPICVEITLHLRDEEMNPALQDHLMVVVALPASSLSHEPTMFLDDAQCQRVQRRHRCCTTEALRVNIRPSNIPTFQHWQAKKRRFYFVWHLTTDVSVNTPSWWKRSWKKK